MKHKINAIILEAEKKEPSEIRLLAIALFRVILQHACFSLVEYLVDRRKRLKANVVYSPLNLSRLLAPSDGTMLEILSEYMLVAENEDWNGISENLLRKRVKERPARRILNRKDTNAESIFREFIKIRNNSVEGHGLPGNYDPEAELDVIRLFLECIEFLLPNISSDGKSYTINFPNLPEYRLDMLRPIDGNIICYRKIKYLSTGKCQIHAQVQTDIFEREEITYEAPNLFIFSDQMAEAKYEFIETHKKEWCPYSCLPNRLTEPSDFTGRKTEIEKLKAWFNDLDARSCMVYGDGGVGKTTLIVEFIYRLLEGTIETEWRPELITFYTAKQTRWGLDGLERIGGKSNVGVADFAVDIVKRLEQKPIGREWYTLPNDKLIDKLAGYLKEWNFDRNSHLIILDNTETMATSSEDVESLADQIKKTSRKAGRVILTSRRLEPLGADPIKIETFSPEESIAFLRKRAESISCKSILQAGNSTLKKQAEKLGKKPLLLEVFLQAAASPGMSLDRAYQRVQRMRNEDLGEFLFSDAWERLSDKLRHLLLLMSQLGYMHDKSLLTLCCYEADVTVIEAEESLASSQGIASVITLPGSHIQITLNKDFVDFCKDRTITIGDATLPKDSSVQRIARRHRDFLRSSQRWYLDRVNRAFIHPYARAARQAYEEHRFKDCDFYYEIALEEDDRNGWLHDRYAHYLMTSQRLEEALETAQRAVELISTDQDAWFTKGMIEARLGRTDEAIRSLNFSERHGKPKHSCLLQKAYAYLNDTPPDNANARACMDESEKATPLDDPYRGKHVSEIKRVRRRMASGDDLRWRTHSADIEN